MKGPLRDSSDQTEDASRDALLASDICWERSVVVRTASVQASADADSQILRGDRQGVDLGRSCSDGFIMERRAISESCICRATATLKSNIIYMSHVQASSIIVTLTGFVLPS